MNNTAKIIKSAAANEKEMALINTYSRRTLTPDEVYTFNVILCDNDIDRDGERFTEKALKTLSELFIGKTGIFDHNPSAENQAARIFSTEVVRDGSRKNALGEDYCYLEAKAYMLKNEKTASLIDEIDGGIKKEVSVGCSMKTKTCSICGTQKGLCSHRAGVEYDGKICFFELDDPTDAYEWSFVAVPAQKNAGVIKAFEMTPEEIMKTIPKDPNELTPERIAAIHAYVKKLEKECAFAIEHKNELEKAVVSEMTVIFPDLSQKLMKNMIQKLNPEELMEMKAYFDRKPAQSQLSKSRPFTDNGRFKI